MTKTTKFSANLRLKRRTIGSGHEINWQSVTFIPAKISWEQAILMAEKQISSLLRSRDLMLPKQEDAKAVQPRPR